MKVQVLYHPNSDHERKVLDFQREFERRSTSSVKLVSLETIEGAGIAKLYGVTQYPAVLVVDERGNFQKMWEGEQMPLINDVEGYALG